MKKIKHAIGDVLYFLRASIPFLAQGGGLIAMVFSNDMKWRLLGGAFACAAYIWFYGQAYQAGKTAAYNEAIKQDG